MTIERSDKVWENYIQSVEQFDYFILGLTGALCAYISQNYKPGKINFNSETLELVALIVLVSAGIAGFIRIQSFIQFKSFNHEWLRNTEIRGDLISKQSLNLLINEATGDIYTPENVKKRIKDCETGIQENIRILSELKKKGVKAYNIRNRLILLGFILELIAKVWSAY